MADWFNNGLPFFNTILTPDGKTGKDLARECLKTWALRCKTDAALTEVAKEIARS